MRRSYGGAVPKATITVNLGGTTADLLIICDDLTGWMDGVTGPFFIIVNRGKPTEEKMLVASRTGDILTVATGGRAVDGTAITTHLVGEVVEHVFTATDADEANQHVNTGTGAHGYPPVDDLVTLDGVQTITNKTIDYDDNTLIGFPGGPQGEQGPPGTVYYQPAAPVAPLDGQIWVESDQLLEAAVGAVYYQPEAPTDPDVGDLWTDSDGVIPSGPIFTDIIDAKGDLIVGTAADVAVRLPVGADGSSPVADSTQTTGIRWAAAALTVPHPFFLMGA